MGTNFYQQNFNGGEISPEIQSRIDLAKFGSSVAKLTNFIPHVQGSVSNRGGFKFIGESLSSMQNTSDTGASLGLSTKTRLIPFQFSTQYSFVIELTDQAFRVIYDGGYLLGDDGEILIGSSPYTKDQIDDVKITQSADVLTMVHKDHDVHALKRRSNTDWEIEKVVYGATNVPPTGLTLQEPSTNDGAGSYTRPYEYVVTSVDVNGNESEPCSPKTKTAHSLSQTAPMTLSWGDTQLFYDISKTYTLVASNGSRPTLSFSGPGSIQVYAGQKLRINARISYSGLGGSSLSDFYITMFDAAGKLTLLSHNGTVSGNNIAVEHGDYIEFKVPDNATGSTTITMTKTHTFSYWSQTGGHDDRPTTIYTTKTATKTVTLNIVEKVTPVPGGNLAEINYYNVYKAESPGSGIYGLIGKTKNLSYKDYNIAPLMTSPPPQYNDPFEEVGSKPTTVNYYQQRLCFAGGVNNPQRFITTATGQYEKFKYSTPTVDTDTVDLVIASNQVNEIRHLVPLKQLVILTSGGEWLVTEGENKILAPGTTGFRQQSYIGSSNVQPVMIGSDALFIQERGSSIYSLSYTYESDGYEGTDLSVLASHLFRDVEIVSWAYARNPDTIVWCVRNDGVMLGLTYNKAQDVWGWHEHTTQGKFKSVTVVSEGEYDAVYVAVERDVSATVNPGEEPVTRKAVYIERMMQGEKTDPANAFYLDSGVTKIAEKDTNGDDIPFSIIDGLEHLEGQKVSILADGNTAGEDVTVLGGQVTISNKNTAVKATVGLKYTSELITLPLDIEIKGRGFTKGMSRKVSQVTVSVVNSRGLFVGQVPDPKDRDRVSDEEYNSNFIESDERTAGMNFEAIPLSDEDHVISINSHYNKRGQISVQQRYPLPLTIVGISRRIEYGNN